MVAASQDDNKGGGFMSYRLQRLLTVKSIVTIILTIGFLILSLTAQDVPQVFAEVYKMIVIFYFGTQAGRKDDTDTTNDI